MKLYYWLKEWQLPGQQDKGASRVEVPTDAAGLCKFLNDRRVPIALPLQPEPEPEPEPEPQPVSQPVSWQSLKKPNELTPREATMQRAWECQSIVEWLHDKASVAEVEAVFAALGTRFGEARRAA